MKKGAVFRGSPVEYNTPCWMKNLLRWSPLPFFKELLRICISKKICFHSNHSMLLVYFYWDKKKKSGTICSGICSFQKTCGNILVTLWVETETLRHPRGRNLDHCSPLDIFPSLKLSNISAGNFAVLWGIRVFSFPKVLKTEINVKR